MTWTSRAHRIFVSTSPTRGGHRGDPWQTRRPVTLLYPFPHRAALELRVRVRLAAPPACPTLTAGFVLATLDSWPPSSLTSVDIEDVHLPQYISPHSFDEAFELTEPLALIAKHGEQLQDARMEALLGARQGLILDDERLDQLVRVRRPAGALLICDHRQTRAMSKGKEEDGQAAQMRAHY